MELTAMTKYKVPTVTFPICSLFHKFPSFLYLWVSLLFPAAYAAAGEDPAFFMCLPGFPLPAAAPPQR